MDFLNRLTSNGLQNNYGYGFNTVPGAPSNAIANPNGGWAIPKGGANTPVGQTPQPNQSSLPQQIANQAASQTHVTTSTSDLIKLLLQLLQGGGMNGKL